MANKNESEATSMPPPSSQNIMMSPRAQTPEESQPNKAENLKVRASTSRDESEESPFKKPCHDRFRFEISPDPEPSVSLEENTVQESKYFSKTSLEMFKASMSDIENGLTSLTQDWIQRWQQLQAEEDAVLASLAQQEASAQSMNEGFQQQLNSLHKSVTDLVSNFKH